MSKEEDSKKLNYDESINDLTEMVLEGIEKEYQGNLEPFEVYANRLRAKIHSQANEYRSRCARGYLVLLEEIMNEKRLGEKTNG